MGTSLAHRQRSKRRRYSNMPYPTHSVPRFQWVCSAKSSWMQGYLQSQMQAPLSQFLYALSWGKQGYDFYTAEATPSCCISKFPWPKQNAARRKYVQKVQKTNWQWRRINFEDSCKWRTWRGDCSGRCSVSFGSSSGKRCSRDGVFKGVSGVKRCWTAAGRLDFGF